MGRHKKKNKDDSEVLSPLEETSLPAVPASTRPVSKKKMILDSDDEEDSKPVQLTVNKAFAREYEETKKIQELAERMTLKISSFPLPHNLFQNIFLSDTINKCGFCLYRP